MLTSVDMLQPFPSGSPTSFSSYRQLQIFDTSNPQLPMISLQTERVILLDLLVDDWTINSGWVAMGRLAGKGIAMKRRMAFPHPQPCALVAIRAC